MTIKTEAMHVVAMLASAGIRIILKRGRNRTINQSTSCNSNCAGKLAQASKGL